MDESQGARGPAPASDADAKDVAETSVNDGTDTAELPKSDETLLPGPSAAMADEVLCENNDISMIIEYIYKALS